MKAYVKPELFVESYELSQHIATCGIDMINPTDTNTCTAQLDVEFWGSSDIVFSGRSECVTDISTIESYCYTAGTDVSKRLFNS